MQLAWLFTQDKTFLCAISTLAQVFEPDFSSRQPKLVRNVNKLLFYAKENPVPLVFERFDLASLQIVGFSDAFLANNADNSTKVGFIIYL